MRKTPSGPVSIARMMIRRHGLHAGAVAQQREALARLQPDARGLELWRYVQRAIAELRSMPGGTRAPEHRS